MCDTLPPPPQTQDSIQGPIDVALIIGLQSCPSSPCVPGNFGSILYNGPFDPQFHAGTQHPYQNFSLTVPSFESKGTAVLSAVHVGLLGVRVSLLKEDRVRMLMTLTYFPTGRLAHSCSSRVRMLPSNSNSRRL